jgi:type I restriction enzyme S subunit
MRKYPKYKASGVDWLTNIPSEWEMLKLRAFGRLQTSSIDKKIVEGEQIINLLNYTDVYKSHDKWLDENIEFMQVSAKQDQIQNNNVGDGDVFFTPSSEVLEEIGFSAVASKTIENTCYSYHLLRLRFNGFGNSKALKSYRRYLFNNEFVLNQFSKGAKGTTRKILNLNEFKETIVPIPSLPEQLSIVRFLDYKTRQIDSFIANRQKQIDLLKEQKAGIIKKAVTKGINPNAKMKHSGIDTLGIIPMNWDVMELKFAAKMMRGKFSHRPRNDERLYGGKFPFIQTGDVTKTEKYITAYKQTLNDWGYNVSKMFPIGTVVITIAANIGDIAILNFNACFPDSIVGFYPKKNKIDYLFYLLKTMKEIFLSESIEGTQLNLSVDRLSSIKVAIPEPDEQQKIIDFINEETSHVDTLISKYQKQIDLIQEYRTSLISQAVTGKIDVREWQPKKQQTR